MHRRPVKGVDNHLTECVLLGAPEFVFCVEKLDLATSIIREEGPGLLLKPFDQGCFEIRLLLVSLSFPGCWLGDFKFIFQRFYFFLSRCCNRSFSFQRIFGRFQSFAQIINSIMRPPSLANNRALFLLWVRTTSESLKIWHHIFLCHPLRPYMMPTLY